MCVTRAAQGTVPWEPCHARAYGKPWDTDAVGERASAVAAQQLQRSGMSRSDVDGRSLVSRSDVMERVEGEEKPSGERISVSGVGDWDEIENVDCRPGDDNPSRSIA